MWTWLIKIRENYHHFFLLLAFDLLLLGFRLRFFLFDARANFTSFVVHFFNPWHIICFYATTDSLENYAKDILKYFSWSHTILEHFWAFFFVEIFDFRNFWNLSFWRLKISRIPQLSCPRKKLDVPHANSIFFPHKGKVELSNAPILMLIRLVEVKWVPKNWNLTPLLIEPK